MDSNAHSLLEDGSFVTAVNNSPAAPALLNPKLTTLRLAGCPGEGFDKEVIKLLHDSGINSLGVFVCAGCDSPAEPATVGAFTKLTKDFILLTINATRVSVF